MTFPFFLTWSSQENGDSFEIQSCDNYHYITQDGQKILDLSSTSYQASFGLKNSEINQAITKQMEHFSVASPKAVWQQKKDVSNKLISSLALGEGKIFFTNSGAESIEHALKIARLVSCKNIVLSRRKSYHGATLGAVSITGDWRRQAPATVDQWNAFIPEPNDDPDCIETEKVILDLGPENIAAICLETITGNNGVIIPSQGWYSAIRALCIKHGILLILDEVLCGFHRTGKYFGFQNYNLKPDIVCFAKGMTGGHFPLGGLFISKPLADHFNKNILSSGLTNYAHPLGIAALAAVQDLTESGDFQRHLARLTEVFHTHLNDLQSHPSVKEIRKIGMLAAIDLNKTAPTWRQLIDNNLYMVSQEERLILSPALTMPSDFLSAGLNKIKEVIS